MADQLTVNDDGNKVTRFGMIRVTDDLGVYYCPTQCSKDLALRLIKRIDNKLHDNYIALIEEGSTIGSLDRRIKQAVARKYRSTGEIADGRDLEMIAPGLRKRKSTMIPYYKMLLRQQDSLHNRRRRVCLIFNAELYDYRNTRL
jgi:hypothetical protein